MIKMSREKIGTVKKFKEMKGSEAKITIEKNGKLKKGDKIAVLGPVAYNPFIVNEIESEKESEITVIAKSEEKVTARENTTVYKIN